MQFHTIEVITNQIRVLDYTNRRCYREINPPGGYNSMIYMQVYVNGVQRYDTNLYIHV